MTKECTVYILMGVSGSGKTTVGEQLAVELDAPFYDGDDFHPPENVAKMASGVPLTDADRQPWLARLHKLIGDHLELGKTAVLACSALKASYRDQLSSGREDICFVYLRGNFDLILGRMQSRHGHYMKADMLRSQFEALEEPTPDEALIVDISHDVESVIHTILRKTHTK